MVIKIYCCILDIAVYRTMKNMTLIAGLAVTIVLGLYLGYTLTNSLYQPAAKQVNTTSVVESDESGAETPPLQVEESAGSSPDINVSVKNNTAGPAEVPEQNPETAETEIRMEDIETKHAVLELFWGEGCPECAAEKEFLEEMRDKYPDLEIIMHEVNEDEEGRELFMERCRELELGCRNVPVTIIGNAAFTGFKDYNGDFTYHKQEKAFVGYRNQIELSIMNELGLARYEDPDGWKESVKLSASTDKSIYYEKEPMRITADIRVDRNVNGFYVFARGLVGKTGPYINSKKWIHLKRGENRIVFEESAPRCFGCGGFRPGIYPIDVWLEKDGEEVARVRLNVEIKDL